MADRKESLIKEEEKLKRDAKGETDEKYWAEWREKRPRKDTTKRIPDIGSWSLGQGDLRCEEDVRYYFV
jgi:hypothetical protein